MKERRLGASGQGNRAAAEACGGDSEVLVLGAHLQSPRRRRVLSTSRPFQQLQGAEWCAQEEQVEAASRPQYTLFEEVI